MVFKQSSRAEWQYYRDTAANIDMIHRKILEQPFIDNYICISDAQWKE